MRGIVVTGQSWTERDDLPAPEPDPVVEVRAAALNHADLDALTGDCRSDQRRADRPRIAGSDLAGVVVRTGSGATGCVPGIA